MLPPSIEWEYYFGTRLGDVAFDVEPLINGEYIGVDSREIEGNYCNNFGGGVISTNESFLLFDNYSILDTGNYGLIIEQNQYLLPIFNILKPQIIPQTSVQFIYNTTDDESEIGMDTIKNVIDCDSIIIVTALEIPISTQDLVAYYPFEGSADDVSDWGNHGFVNCSTLTNDRCNRENGAYALDGLQDHITIPHQEWINFSNLDTFTISLWISISEQVDLAVNQNEILTKWDDNGMLSYPYTIRLFNQRSTDRIPGTIIAAEWKGSNCSTAGASVASEASNYMDDKFHHIIYKKVRLEISLYIDNMHITTSMSQDTCEISNEFPLFIGRRNSDGDRLYFKGVVDELLIFRRAISNEEIDILFDINSCNQLTEISDNYYPLLTPNGDGFNDVLFFDSLDQFSNNSLRIFNRYGQLVYEVSQYENDWGGTYKETNKILPDGTYYYVLGINNNTPVKGHITLLTSD